MRTMLFPLLAGLLLLGTLTGPSLARALSFVDSAGRQVEVPDRASKIYASGPPASIYLYMLKLSDLMPSPLR